MAISFTRTFVHPDWADNVDRVQASGDSGFNERFHAIEADLDTISSAFRDAQQLIDALSARLPPSEVLLTLTPALLPSAVGGLPPAQLEPAWGNIGGAAYKLGGQTGAGGYMSVDLPHGATITSLRAVGIKEGSGGLIVALWQEELHTSSAGQPLIVFAPNPQHTSFFDVTQAPSSPVTVDNTQIRYWIQAGVRNAAVGDQVGLFTFQIALKTPEPS
jgi:hypothetical protein